ncbi:hypothetical protein HNP33_001141 [Comamonas odontotermitis]|uniref:Uncharacterized protein n=1 Tax=Comamonas odontotermitis TaxID=379895 RepID=A0ABR6RD51_9BURK|nr:hypothetical protein [Comamonas odontotermitis]MBB6577090.1 hypothetical protein [Comamonas odontotermitis]
MAIDKTKTFQFGALINAFVGLLAETLDAININDYDFSFVGAYSGKDPLTRKWLVKDYDWVTICVAYWPIHQLRCVLSREGQIRLYAPGGSPDKIYQLPGAGVIREDALGLGYVNRIRAIGNALYVCGQSRQVYRFEPGAQQVLDGSWFDFAGPMRQAPISDPPEGDGEEFDRWLDANDAIDFVDIDGSSENDIYAVGDECWHYHNGRWRQLQLPTDEFINAIKVISASEVFLLGHNGTLLYGNAQAGFTDLSSIDDNQNLTSAEVFEGKLYLASNLGLFVYDPQIKKIEPCPTSLQPELQDTHILEAKDGILWSFGFKDLAYFDGHVWTRVDHPDNPPIR